MENNRENRLKIAYAIIQNMPESHKDDFIETILHDRMERDDDCFQDYLNDYKLRERDNSRGF